MHDQDHQAHHHYLNLKVYQLFHYAILGLIWHNENHQNYDHRQH
jgi:hypothetical protein